MVPQRYVLCLLLAAACCISAGDASHEGTDGVTPDAVRISLEEYTRLYDAAFMTERKVQQQKEAEEQEAKLRRAKNEYEENVTDLRRAYAKKFAKLQEQGTRPSWVREGATELWERATGSYAVLDTHIEASWDAGGPHRASHAKIDFSLDLRVFEDRWTAVPLLDAATITDNWQLGHADEVGRSNLVMSLLADVQGTGANHTATELLKTCLDKSQTQAGHTHGVDSHPQAAVYADLSGAEYRAPRSTEAGLLVVPYAPDEPHAPPAKDTHVFVAQRAGLYRLSFTTFSHVRALNKIKNDMYTVALPMLNFAVSEVQFNFSQSTAESTSQPFVSHVTTTPGGFVKGERMTNSTQAFVLRLPLTKTVDVRWRMLDGAAQAEEEHVPPTGKRPEKEGADPKAKKGATQSTSTVKHEAVHSVEEGNIMQSKHFLQYTLSQDDNALTDVRIRVYPSEARVTSVTAMGVSSWKVQQTSAGYAVLHVRMQNAVTEALLLQVGMEYDFSYIKQQNDMRKVDMPKLLCEGVLRQAGSFAVAKVASIEVHEATLQRGVSRIAVEDLSEYLRFHASSGPNPLILAYRYVSHSAGSDGSNASDAAAVPSLSLRVQTHSQMDTLPALVEAAHYEVVVMENGRSLHRLLLNMQNTNEQYLHLHRLPASAKVWGLAVNSVATKPVQGDVHGEDGLSLLIPLLVGLPSDVSTRSTANVPRTSIELVFASKNGFSEGNALHNTSDSTSPIRAMNISAPLIARLPVRVLTQRVFFPSEYAAAFTSEAVRADATPHALWSAHRDVVEAGEHGTASHIMGPVTKFSQRLPRSFAYHKGRRVVPKGHVFTEHDTESDTDATDSAAPRGLKIDIHETGTPYNFERALLEAEQALLSVVYQRRVVQQPVQPSWAARMMDTIQKYIF